MVVLISKGKSKFFEVNSNHFTTALTVSSEEEDAAGVRDEVTSLCLDKQFLAVSASNESTTLRLSHINMNSPWLSTNGMLSLMNHYENIRELSLSYSLLSDELLRALSSDETLHHLETVRVEAHPETKPASSVSYETWDTFTNNLPDVNLVLLTYLTEAKDYEGLLAEHVPLTHLFFGESAPSSVVASVGGHCPRLIELIVSAYEPDTIDQTLIAAARGCPRLSAVGLGDCELTCSGFIEFVSLCCERLQVLYVLDTSLLEDSEYDITDVSAKVTSLMGKYWQPNYVPYW